MSTHTTPAFTIKTATGSDWLVTETAQGGLIVSWNEEVVRRVTPAYVRKLGSAEAALERLYRGDQYSRAEFLAIVPA